METITQTVTTTISSATDLVIEERNHANPNQWGGTYAFTGYIMGIQVKVSICHGNVLVIRIPYQDASLLDVEPVSSVTAPNECLAWIRRHVPTGPERDWLIDYYTRIDLTAWINHCRQIAVQRLEKWEAEQKEAMARIRSPEYQRQQMQRLILDMARAEPATPSSVRIPVETATTRKLKRLKKEVPAGPLKIFWGIYNGTGKRVDLLDYIHRRTAEEKAEKLSQEGKYHFVVKVKKAED